MIEFLLKYGNLILVLVILVVAPVAAIINFFKLSPKQRLKNVKEWLLLVVMQAEQIYGGGTGVIKLRYAYEEFITKFPDLAKILPFGRALLIKTRNGLFNERKIDLHQRTKGLVLGTVFGIGFYGLQPTKEQSHVLLAWLFLHDSITRGNAELSSRRRHRPQISGRILTH